ncbi:MAG: hypothetical protein ACFE9T_02245 [Promethearchaeota archaeon]
MEKIANLRFFVPLIFIMSIFLGPVYSFLMFFYQKFLNSYWSFRITILQFADVMALTFILFSIVFIITFLFLKKIAIEPAISFSFILIGFCCIYAAFATNWIIYLTMFIIIGGTIGFVLPKFLTLIGDITKIEEIRKSHLLVIPISILAWLITQSIIFEVMGMQSWRILYIVIGLINIVSSPITLLYKKFE